MKTIRLAIAVVVALSTGQSAGAADYLFKVPVDVRDLPPQITVLNVTCVLIKDTGGLYLGTGTKQVMGVSGSHTGLVEVDVNLNSGVTDAPVSWQCTLSLGGTIAGVSRFWDADIALPPNAPDRLIFRDNVRPPNLPQVLPSRAGTTPVTRNQAQF
jgi:hypothetical protein